LITVLSSLFNNFKGSGGGSTIGFVNEDMHWATPLYGSIRRFVIGCTYSTGGRAANKLSKLGGR
jgi:hypothetical protein